MMGTAPTVNIPAVFFDGEREIDIGNICIYPSLDFKILQSILGQRIGVSPLQISVFLISRKTLKSRFSMDNLKKSPINERVNFAAIVREKDCFFLVELKNRERRQKPRQNLEESHDYSSFPIELLRRDSGMKLPQFESQSPLNNQITSPYGPQTGQLPLEHLDFENQIQNLLMQRERYLTTLNSYPYTRMVDGHGHGFGRMNERIRNLNACEECVVARGKLIQFHHCVNDPITVSFRSTAGPIARPSNASS